MHAGLPSDKLRWIGDLGHFTCDQLLFTNTQTRHHYTTPPIVRRLHSMWPTGMSRPGRRKLWITRRNARMRHVQWEDAFLKQLPEFEVVEPQNLSPAAQMDLMRSAGSIAGPHGAGLAGMVFAPAGTKIFEFRERSEGVNACFSRLAQVSGADHYAVQIDFKNESDVGWLRGWV